MDVEQPAPPPLRNPLLDEVVQSEGACGRSERVHLAPASLGRVRYASPRAQVVLLQSPEATDDRLTVFHAASGRATPARGWPVAFSRDERRVLLWEVRKSDWQGRVHEVDAVMGTTRLLLDEYLPVPSTSVFPGQAWMWTGDRRTFRYVLEDGRFEQLSGPSTRRFWSATAPGQPQRALLAEGLGFVVWDGATGERWKVEEAKGAVLLEDGSGAVYVDAEGTAWGWTPERPPARLGHYGSVPGNELPLRTRRPSASGDLLVAISSQETVRWNVRTGAVAPVASEDAWAARSPSGTQLLITRELPEGGRALVVHDLGDGSERVLMRSAVGVSASWSPDGSHVLATEWLDSGNVAFRLFHGADAREVVLQPALGGSYWKTGASFADEGRVLHARTADGHAFYSTADGSLRYATARAVQWAGHFYYWGPDGVFYGQDGAWYDPDGDNGAPQPDEGLFAWNPRTGVETELGESTKAVCFLGSFHLFRHDLPAWAVSSGPLSSWVSATGERRLLSRSASDPTCTPSHAGVVFMEGLGPQLDEKAPVVFASPARGCRQTLAEGVRAFWPREDHVLLLTDTGVWRASYPEP